VALTGRRPIGFNRNQEKSGQQRSTVMKTLSAAMLILAVATIPAYSAEVCKEYEKSQWMSKEDISKKAIGMGYEVRSVEEEDGCWEVKGKKDGNLVEVYFDPATSEVILVK
jgi:hypothetical protein